MIARGYNEDSVLLTMLPAIRQSSRRTTILIFFDNGETAERRENETHTGNFADYFADNTDVIMPGDLIHVDFGIEYLSLSMDTQRNAYVLRPGKTGAPERF